MTAKTAVTPGSTHVTADTIQVVFGQPCLGSEEARAVEDVLRSGWIGTGPRCREFERSFAAYKGVDDALALNSCTAALFLALHHLGIGAGDEVLLSPVTFAATANVVVHTGAQPVFVDCDPETGNLDPRALERAATGRTRAVIVVHLAGRPVDLGPVLEFCERRDLRLIEDCAHAVEGSWRGRKLGTIGDAGCFSFYASKNLTTGEGGMLLARDSEMLARCRRSSLHGLSADAWRRSRADAHRHPLALEAGYKFNLTDIQAAIGLVQLGKLERHAEHRARLWAFYDAKLAGLPLELPPPAAEGDRHARHLYSPQLVLEDAPLERDHLLEALRREGIGSGVHFISLHLHPYYHDVYEYAPQTFPNALRFSQRTFSLPLSGCLSLERAELVTSALRRLLTPGKGRRVPAGHGLLEEERT